MTPRPTRTPTRHVVLVGLPGAGKSTIGRHLARLVGRPFADADRQLELTLGTTIPQLVHDHGPTALNHHERQILDDLLLRLGPLVIAAPGAVALDPADQALLARTAVVVWIHGPLDLLTQLATPTHRPRLTGDHHAALAALDTDLAPVYGPIADHIIDIAPFHTAAASGGPEPATAIAEHLLDALGLPASSLPLPPPPAADLAARYAEIADHVVDVTADDPPPLDHLLALLATHGIRPR